VLHERLVGVLCLGAATLGATWGGNGALNEASAQAERAARALQAGAITSAAHQPDPGPAPAGDLSTTTLPVPESATTTVPAGGVTTTTVPPGEAPAVLAKRALLAHTDVPAGFTVTSPAPPDTAPLTDSPVERCAGPDAPGITAAIGARARSATFARPDTGSVSSTAVVFDQPASAEKALGLLTTSVARSCFESLINARLARNPNLSQDVQGSLGPAPSPSVGEGALAYRFEVRLPAEDVDSNARPDDPPVRYVADFLLVRKGRTLVLAEFANLRQPWSDVTLRDIATNLVAHA
jgi:hypothetical protein